MATGTSDAFPFAGICNTPNARGPVSFFVFGLRSPGIICGRPSCANDAIALTVHAKSKTSAAPQGVIRRCKIFRNALRLGLGPQVGTFDSALNLGIGMKVNDKAPDFSLPDENGKDVSLKDLHGKTVILFFYPRANTPG